ncbi:MAG: hypothetical protein J5595_09760 [Bacteroidales bacterium]|nr:hypothetical protein [Bacteroidales bacterium]
MKKQNDNDIREALRRKEAKRQPVEVPDDFLESVMGEIEPQPKSIKLWRYVAIAAGIALLIGIGAIIAFQEQSTTTIADVADISTFTSARQAQPVVVINTDTPKAEPSKSEKPKPPVKKSKQTPPPTNEDQPQETIIAEQTMPNTEIHYIAPSKMDEAIARMADHQHAEKQVFECEPDSGKDVKELLYVFEDNDDFDLMGKLILSACHFDENTSGYFLNYSQQKFFFCINDELSGRTYTWIADRMSDGKMLLFCANAPQEDGITSDCYISYFNKTSSKNMNTYTNL